MLQAQHRNLEQTGAANAKALAQAAAILAGASTVHVAGFRPATRSPSAFTICTVCSAIPCTWYAATPARWKWTCGP